MKTTSIGPLSPHDTLFDSKEAYFAFVRRWKDLARAKALTREDCLLRCLVLKQDVSASFAVIKNLKRLANGAIFGSGQHLAFKALRHANPVSAFKTRQERLTRWQTRGRVAPSYVTECEWSEKWVDPANPATTKRGMSEAVFKAAQVAALHYEQPA